MKPSHKGKGPLVIRQLLALPCVSTCNTKCVTSASLSTITDSRIELFCSYSYKRCRLESLSLIYFSLNRSRTAATDVPLTYCFCWKKCEAARRKVSNQIQISFSFCNLTALACFPVMSYSFASHTFHGPWRYYMHKHIFRVWLIWFCCKTHTTLMPCLLWNSSREKVSIRCDMIYLLFITLTPVDDAVLQHIVIHAPCDSPLLRVQVPSYTSNASYSMNKQKLNEQSPRSKSC